jgi:hypothetical protein
MKKQTTPAIYYCLNNNTQQISLRNEYTVRAFGY